VPIFVVLCRPLAQERYISCLNLKSLESPPRLEDCATALDACGGLLVKISVGDIQPSTCKLFYGLLLSSQVITEILELKNYRKPIGGADFVPYFWFPAPVCTVDGKEVPLEEGNLDTVKEHLNQKVLTSRKKTGVSSDQFVSHLDFVWESVTVVGLWTE
jgi:hypothetical protein